jgi:hypothetical protein
MRTAHALIEDFPNNDTFSKWDSAIKYADQLGQKHNFRFLMYSYFDGVGYYERICKAIKSLSNLRKGKEEWIFFPDEIATRASWALGAYYSEYNIIEAVLTNIIDKVPSSNLAELGWIAKEFGWEDQEFEIPSLEASIVSGIIHKKYDKLNLETNINDKRIPFDLIKKEDFIKMRARPATKQLSP